MANDDCPICHRYSYAKEDEMKVEYVSKRWIAPVPLAALLRRLHYKVVGALGEDDYIVKRYGQEESLPFYLFHISWGDRNGVAKYKLFRIHYEE